MKLKSHNKKIGKFTYKFKPSEWHKNTIKVKNKHQAGKAHLQQFGQTLSDGKNITLNIWDWENLTQELFSLVMEEVKSQKEAVSTLIATNLGTS